MIAKWTKPVAAAVFASVFVSWLLTLGATLCATLAGCEVVAGIRDLHLSAATGSDSGGGSDVVGQTAPSGDDGASPAGDDAEGAADPDGAFASETLDDTANQTE